MRSKVAAVVIVVAGFSCFFWLGTGPLTSIYTADWTAGVIPVLFGPIAVAAAVLVPRSALWSLGGYALGVTLGELIGTPVYQAQVARLQDQLQDPAYSQDWEPSHPGWWIAILVFLTITAIGCWLGRPSRRVHPSPGADLPPGALSARRPTAST